MKLHWGYGITLAYVIFAGSMVAFVIVASKQKNELVTDNYYEQAVNYQQKIDAGNNALTSESKVSISFSKDQNTIEIMVTGEQKAIQGNLSFYKPDNARDDFKLAFSTGDAGKQVIPLKNISKGAWDINAEWFASDKPCASKTRIYIQ